MQILLPLVPSAAPTAVTLHGSHTTLTPAASNPYSGQLNGAISQHDLTAVVFPALGVAFTMTLNDPATTGTNKALISALIDVGSGSNPADPSCKAGSNGCKNADGSCSYSGDGVIGGCEIANSPVGAAFKPDIQLFAADGVTYGREAERGQQSAQRIFGRPQLRADVGVVLKQWSAKGEGREMSDEKSKKRTPAELDEFAAHSGLALSERFRRFWLEQVDDYAGKLIGGLPSYTSDTQLKLRFKKPSFDLFEENEISRDENPGRVPLATLADESQFLAVDAVAADGPVTMWEHEDGQFKPVAPSLDAFLGKLVSKGTVPPIKQLKSAYKKASALNDANQNAEALALLEPAIAQFAAVAESEDDQEPLADTTTASSASSIKILEAASTTPSPPTRRAWPAKLRPRPP